MTVELVLLPRVAYRDKEISSPRLRSLLALLARDLRTGCSTATLVDGLWPDEQPVHPTKALQVLVSRARSTVGTDVIASTPVGYRLALPEDRVDASAALGFASASARHARSGDHTNALAQAEAGLTLWEGHLPPDAGLADPLSVLRRERASTHRSLVRARALALSRLGRCDEAVEPLSAVAGHRPRDEEVLLELLRCEASTAGPSAALARYEAYRRSLRDELGSDPGVALQDQHRQLLQDLGPRIRHGIAHEPNPLLGRDDDIAAVATLLGSSRVTSIVGPGGLGKTRLAHAISRRAAYRMVHVVTLVGVAADDDVVDEVASVLGVGEPPRAPGGRVVAPTDPVAGIVGALGSGTALLVLDNCEHVVRGVADLVRRLVAMTPDLRILTTSRAPLGLSSEAVYQLPGLTLPTAVELFGQRARAIRPDVDLPTDGVEQVCRHLDGLPLAVELAAARVRAMTVADIASGLTDRFGLLRGGARDAPARHRTLHAVVDWSWNLLAPKEQAAMRALSIVPGGFTADAAQQLLGGDGGLATLEHLVEQSLLTVDDTSSGARFSMLETVREFSAARRESEGDGDRVRGAFLSWARAFGTAHHDAPFGADPFAAVERMRAEQDNMAHALGLGLDCGDVATVAATSAALSALWMIDSNVVRLGVLVDDTVAVLPHVRPDPDLVEVTRTALTLCALNVALVRGPRATRWLVALRRLPPAAPNTLGRALAVVLGAGPDGPVDLPVLCASDEPLIAGAANYITSYMAERCGDVDGALLAAHRALGAVSPTASPWAWAGVRARVAELCLQLEQGAQARAHLEAALPVVERLGIASDVVGIRWWLVLANLQIGAVDDAERWLEHTASRGVDADVITVTYGLGARAEILLARGDVEAGLRLWRDVVDRLRHPGGAVAATDPSGLATWAAEAEAVTVIAHAHHGQLQRVEAIVDRLPARLSTMLASPASSPFRVELPVVGALLLASGMADLVCGRRSGDGEVIGVGIRLIALAACVRFGRIFQPTMSSARARQAAEAADRSAYDDALASYAGVGPDELRTVAGALLGEALL